MATKARPHSSQRSDSRPEILSQTVTVSVPNSTVLTNVRGACRFPVIRSWTSSFLTRFPMRILRMTVRFIDRSRRNRPGVGEVRDSKKKGVSREIWVGVAVQVRSRSVTCVVIHSPEAVCPAYPPSFQIAFFLAVKNLKDPAVAYPSRA